MCKEHAIKRQAIVDLLKRLDYTDLKERATQDDITFIAHELESAGLIDFDIEERQSESDYWLEVTYYCKRIGKTIIYDYDYSDSFDSLNKMIDQFIKTDEDIARFASGISYKEVDCE